MNDDNVVREIRSSTTAIVFAIAFFGAGGFAAWSGTIEWVFWACVVIAVILAIGCAIAWLWKNVFRENIGLWLILISIGGAWFAYTNGMIK